MIDGYTLLGARSHGAMGIVHQATENATGRTVAIKLLRQNATRFAHTFARERDALHALSHPNIVRYIGHGETPDGLPYLVTEWLEGEDLESRLARGKLSVAAAVDHALAIARALGAAHAQGIVHRDVKPANIHLGADGVVKLLDFGVAHLGDAHAGAVAVGTALYMAPEQVRATGTADARSDIYALGCVLFECLTGRPPFTGDRATVVLAKAIFELPPRVTSLGVEASPALDALVARMLSKQAAARPHS
ncbi:MAG: serine/threonine-protein kinase, partial [Polyangiaceae bacterium]